MITANEVKNTLKSLLAKINKETGIEHPTISEGVETLVLGYGAGEAKDYDGKILIDGEPIKDYKDYYEEGRQAGLSEAGRIIYGAFILNATQSPVVSELSILSEPAGVYANFYNGSEYVKELIHSISLSVSEELVCIYNYDQSKYIKYLEIDGVWIYGCNDVSGELPDSIGRIIEFSEPISATSALFNAFDEISSTNIEETIVAMVEQRLINVSEEGM